MIWWLGMAASQAHGAWMGLLVPAYFAPSRADDWAALAEAAAQVPVVAIVNVFNGPGPVAREDYGRVIQAVRANGGRVIGYVHANYARRPLDEVEEDMRRWANRYALDGFFVDEMANDGLAAGLDYFAAVYREAKWIHPAGTVIGNPGTTTREVYLSRPVADAVVTFENRTGYSGYLPDAWNRRYPAQSFAHLCYEVGSAVTMTNYLRLADQRGTGWVYVTDDTVANPWDRLPGYWTALVAWIRERNRSVPMSLTATYGGGALRLRAESAPGRYTIESSTNLLRWADWYAAGAPTGRLELVIPDAGWSIRFLRARR